LRLRGVRDAERRRLSEISGINLIVSELTRPSPDGSSITNARHKHLSMVRWNEDCAMEHAKVTRRVTCSTVATPLPTTCRFVGTQRRGACTEGRQPAISIRERTNGRVEEYGDVEEAASSHIDGRLEMNVTSGLSSGACDTIPGHSVAHS